MGFDCGSDHILVAEDLELYIRKNQGMNKSEITNVDISNANAEQILKAQPDQ